MFRKSATSSITGALSIPRYSVSDEYNLEGSTKHFKSHINVKDICGSTKSNLHYFNRTLMVSSSVWFSQHYKIFTIHIVHSISEIHPPWRTSKFAATLTSYISGYFATKSFAVTPRKKYAVEYSNALPLSIKSDFDHQFQAVNVRNSKAVSVVENRSLPILRSKSVNLFSKSNYGLRRYNFVHCADTVILFKYILTAVRS